MGEKLFYTIVALGLLVFVTYMNLTTRLEPIHGIAIMHLFGALLFGWAAVRLHQIYKKLSPEQRRTDPVLNTLRWYFIFGTIFSIVDIIPHHLLIVYFPVDLQVLTIVHWIGHIFLTVQTVLSAIIAVSFLNPRWKTPVATIGALVGLAGLVASALNPDILRAIPTFTYPIIVSTPQFGYFNTAMNILLSGVSALFLIFKGLSSWKPVASGRMIMLGIGFLFFVGAGFFINQGGLLHIPNNTIYINACLLLWPFFTGLPAIAIAKDRLRGIM